MAHGIDGVVDMVIIKGEIIPQSDIEGAYCLMVVDFTAIDHDSKESYADAMAESDTLAIRKDESESSIPIFVVRTLAQIR